MSSPYEIRLIVQQRDAGYVASWTSPQGQLSEEFPLTLPLTAEEAAELRWYLETYIQFPGAGDRARAQKLEERLVYWGKALFDALFGTAEGTQVYNDLMSAEAPRLVTLGSNDPAVLAQPWELMRDRRGRSSPLVFQDVIVRRQLQGAKRRTSQPLGLPLRVLLIVSRPSDTGFIDPRNSIAPLVEVLEMLPAGLVEVDFCEPPTLPGLEQRIAQARRTKQPYHIVHFDGHGTYLAKTGVGALAFEREDATTHLVPGVTLGDLLARLDVPLVLLEACRGADLSDKAVFGSVAPALLESGVGSVVAFSHSVHVQAARLLVERFYAELAAGLSVGQALAEARVRLRSAPARWLHRGPNAESVDLQDWFIPQLYQVGPDPVLLAAGHQAVRQAIPPFAKGGRGGISETDPRLHDFPPAPLYRFHGRAQELLELERAFRRYPAVLLHAMGGMGKTALAREAAFRWLRTGRIERAVFCSFEQKAGVERVMQVLGQALEGERFSARSPEEQWRSAVAGFRQRRVLLVWDNFESTLARFQEGEDPDSPLVFSAEERDRLLGLYRELTEGNPSGRLLVTCRPWETGLPGIKELPLGGLARPDSLHLLAAVLDQKSIRLDRPGYERDRIDALLDDLDDHPLSIELIAPHFRDLTPARIREDFGKLVAQFANGDAFESRNRSLLASLEFSKRRLSAGAQAVLPSLAWFQGGVFEQFLLTFAEWEADAWSAVRAELVETALLKVEHLPEFNTPYLRFHPTLPYAARAEAVADPDAAEQRFIAVYRAVRRMADDALRGNQPAAGMALLAREEGNLRAAIRRAFRRGERQAGWEMADTLRDYLERAGRLREREALVAWVQAQMPTEAGLDHATWAATLDHAWSQFTQGQTDAAVQTVQGLIERLKKEGLADGDDPAFQFAVSYLYLGRIYVNAGRSDRALAPLHQAIAGFERLGDSQRDNLATALGDLANAQMTLGQLDAALATAERGLALDRALGRDREIATGLVQSAQILRMQQRYAEAEARYGEALRAAQAAGDLGLQGLILQHQGGLKDALGQHDQAVALYQQAMILFQRAADLGAEMQTCDLLASAELHHSQLDAAEAWYRRSRELAEQRDDKRQLAAVAQNLGILYQTRAEQIKDDPARCEEQLRQAVAAVEESLAIELEMQNQVGAAASYFQLGVLHRLLSDLAQAEKHALQALQIDESLNLPEVYKDYGNLAAIARDRGDSEAAARWQAKRDAKLAELEQRWRGDGGTNAALPDEVVQFILTLAQAAYAARQSQAPLPPDAAEALAQLAEAPAPFPAVGAFLKAIAEGQPVPAVPEGLPGAVREILEKLAEAVRASAL